MQHQTVPAPIQLSENQVKVEVRATGIGFRDAAACLNPSLLPLIDGKRVGGYELAGVIIDAHPSVMAKWPIGTEVMGWMPNGGALQSEVVIPISQLVLKPDYLSMAEAAALPMTYVAAWQLLNHVVELQRTQRMLVHGGAGALGTALITLGRAMGLEIYTTADAKYHGRLHLLGASPINYQAEDFLRAVRRLSIDGAHAVFDSLGHTLVKSWDCLRPGGTLVSTGYISAERTGGVGSSIFAKMTLAWMKLSGGNKRYLQYNPSLSQWQQRWHQDLVQVLSLLKAGKLEVTLAPTITPTEVPKFLADLLNRKSPMGKTVVVWP